MRLAASGLVVNTLAGSWRASPPPCNLTDEELRAVGPLLEGSGAGGVGWWRIRGSSLAGTAAGESLHQVFRLQALRGAVFEEKIKQAFATLRAAGIEPILAKGWALGRLYADPALRPYGDIDVAVAPEDLERAQAIVRARIDSLADVDLEHEELAGRSADRWSGLYRRSRLVPLDDIPIRVLGSEDQLAWLCAHFARHGLWRPLWLCDIAAALESRPPDFDWGLFLESDLGRQDWMGCAVRLAGVLLGAEVSDVPGSLKDQPLPEWLVSAVLERWNDPRPEAQPPFSYGPPLVARLRRPRELPRALRARWPTGLQATVALDGPFDDAPRLPYQLRYVWRRTTAFLRAG